MNYANYHYANLSRVSFHLNRINLSPVYINVLMTGCASGWLPNAIYFFGVEKEVPVSSYEYSLIASCSDLGKMGFAIPGGFIIDRFGRKQIIICAGILNFSCWLALSLHSSLITICVVRLVVFFLFTPFFLF